MSSRLFEDVINAAPTVKGMCPYGESSDEWRTTAKQSRTMHVRFTD